MGTLLVSADIDLEQGELKNATLENLPSPPASPVEGQVYHDTTLHYAREWDGTQWLPLSNAGSKFAADIGDGVALAYTVTHNLNTRDVLVAVYDNTTFDEVRPAVSHTTVNEVTVTFLVAPTANQYRVVVHS